MKEKIIEYITSLKLSSNEIYEKLELNPDEIETLFSQQYWGPETCKYISLCFNFKIIYNTKYENNHINITIVPSDTN